MRYLIGIGNYYGLDDSIGLRVAEAVGERGLDRGFQAIDLGGNLLDLVHYVGEGSQRVLIVDAADMSLPPGEFQFFAIDTVATRKATGGLSTHEGDVLKVLEFAEAAGALSADVTIMGIQVAEVGSEPGLSPPLEERFDEYVAAAVGFLGDEG